MNRQREMSLIDTRCSPSFISFLCVCVCALILQVCSNTHIDECKCVCVCTRLSVELNNQRICHRCQLSLLFSALIFSSSFLSLSLSLPFLFISPPLLLFSFFLRLLFTTIFRRINRNKNYYHDQLFIEVVESLSSHATRR